MITIYIEHGATSAAVEAVKRAVALGMLHDTDLQGVKITIKRDESTWVESGGFDEYETRRVFYAVQNILAGETEDPGPGFERTILGALVAGKRMGRPPKPAGQAKAAQLQVRTTQPVIDHAQALADAAGMSRNAWIEALILKAKR